MTISVQSGFGGGVGPGPYAGPFDILGAASTFWGLRAYKAANIPNACCSITRPSGSPSQQAFNSTVSNGIVDVAAIAAFLGGNTGTVSVLQDQSGNGRNLQGNAVGHTFPTFVLADATSLPCFRLLRANNQSISAIAFNTLAQPFSYVGVFLSNNGASDNAIYFGSNQQGITPQNFGGSGFSGAPDTAFMQAGVSLTNTHATHGALHSFVAVFNGASSHLYIDGIDSAGDAGTANIGNNIYTLGGDGIGGHSWTGDGKEVGIWARVITPTEVTAYHAQVRTVWGF